MIAKWKTLRVNWKKLKSIGISFSPCWILPRYLPSRRCGFSYWPTWLWDTMIEENIQRRHFCFIWFNFVYAKWFIVVSISIWKKFCSIQKTHAQYVSRLFLGVDKHLMRSVQLCEYLAIIRVLSLIHLGQLVSSPASLHSCWPTSTCPWCSSEYLITTVLFESAHLLWGLIISFMATLYTILYCITILFFSHSLQCSQIRGVETCFAAPPPLWPRFYVVPTGSQFLALSLLNVGWFTLA